MSNAENKRLIDIDEFIKWYDEVYKNWPDDCTRNKERVYTYYNLFVPHDSDDNLDNNGIPVSDGK